MEEKLKNKIDEDEIASNRFTFKCMVIMTLIIAATVVLNVLDIFIIQSRLMFVSFGGCIACTALAAIVVAIVPDKPVTKYILLTLMVIFVTILGIFLTYHIVLVSVIPILCSAQYKNNKLIMFSYFVTVVSIVVIVMAGYYYGICDANMLTLTSHTKDNYIDPVTGEFTLTAVNSNPWATLPLYYAFPRCLVIFATIPMIRHLSDVISQSARRETELRILGETDMMTQFYNKNKYLEMIEKYYPTVDNVGVMFWDINGLKRVNDTMGHDCGDYLISSVTSSILEFTNEACKAYRIGGDEFVVITEGLSTEDMEDMIVKSRKSIEKKDKMSKFPISASVGYAQGEGKDIEKVIFVADSNMYKNKKAFYDEKIKERKADS